MRAWVKKIQYPAVCGFLTAAFLFWGIFVLWQPYVRIFNGACDLGTSIGFYFTELLGFKGVVPPTVMTLPDFWQKITPETPDVPPIVLPETPEGFQSKWSVFIKLLVSGNNLSGYLGGVGRVLNDIVIWLMLLLPLVILAVIVLRRALNRENNNYNVDSKPLKVAKKAASITYIPVKKWITGLIIFLCNHAWIVKLWVFIALLNFNILTIILEALAYYFYFVASFSFSGIYLQVYKLVLDLGLMFKAVPVWVWFISGYALFLYLRRKIAYNRLWHMEMRDRGFINSLPIVSMICGTMGKKKTTMLTDIALSQDIMFRDKAYEKLLDNDLKFPNFPWINLENDIKAAIESHRIYSLATCKTFIEERYKEFNKTLKWCFKRGIEPRSGRHPCLLWGYDYNRYGTAYDNKLYVAGLWDVIKTYVHLYYIYVIQSTLLIANYSIRTDSVISDVGNFPLWNANFFKRDSRLLDKYSQHAHILDFDMLRLGRKVLDDNPQANAFEFGVVPITEVGKERGNQVENKGMKKTDYEANQLNDGFNKWLKMVRHSATVDNYPFVKVIMDEQRPESLGADVRELCDIIHIRDSGEARLALPFFYVENLIYDFLFPRFERFYQNYRYSRGDNTLIMYVFKKIAGIFHNYYTRTHNLFSYSVLQIEKERGTQDGAAEGHKYYLMSKKIYAKRFATDAFSDYFTNKSLRSPMGLADIVQYVTERATLDELQAQDSYFINELQENFKE